MSEPKKVDRRKFIYAGLGAVALIAIGAAAYVAMNPPVVTQTVTTSTTVPTTSVVTTTVPTTSVVTTTVPTTSVVTTTTEILPPIPDFNLAKIDWKQCAGTEISYISTTAARNQYLSKRSKDFEELTGIKVKFDLLAEREFDDKTFVIAQSGSGTYDVITIKPANQSTFIMRKWVDPTYKYLEDSKLCDQKWYNISDFFPGALMYGQFDESTNTFGTGKQHTIPMTGALEMLPILYYRTDILKELDIKLPQTFDELEQACKIIKQKKPDIVPFVTRGCRMAGTWNIPLAMIGCYGGNIFDEEWYPILNRPEAIEAVEKYVTLMKDYGPPGAATYDNTKARQFFMSGNAVFYLDSSLYWGTMTDPTQSKVADKIGVTEIPAGPKGRKTNFLTWGMAPDPNAKNRKAAWLFIMWATSAKIEYETMAAGSGVSCRRSTHKEKVIQEKWGPLIDVHVASEKYAQILPPVIIGGTVQDIFSTYTSSAIDGQMSAKEACLRSNEELYKAMKEAGYYDEPKKYGKYYNGGNVIPHSSDWKP